MQRLSYFPLGWWPVSLLLFLGFLCTGAFAAPSQTIRTATLVAADGAKEVSLPHVLAASEYKPEGSLVRFRLQFEPAQGCHVLLYPEGMIKLNDSASEILQQVDGKQFAKWRLAGFFRPSVLFSEESKAHPRHITAFYRFQRVTAPACVWRSDSEPQPLLVFFQRQAVVFRSA